MKLGTRRTLLATTFEGSLALLGILLAWLFALRIPLHSEEPFQHIALGTAWALVGGLAFVALYHWPIGSFQRIRRILDESLIPWFQSCSILELALLAVAAGVGEEVLFRGYLQVHLSQLLGSREAGLIIASVIFGICHLATWTYGLVATLIGLGLGAMFLQTGNLVAPIVTHSLYDFLGLVYAIKVAPVLRPSIATKSFSTHENEECSTMKAAYIQQTGPAENITVGDLPKPKAQAGQVLVKVSTVAVNPIDTYVRAGVVKMPIPIPFIVGCDLAGVVEEVGPGVTRFRVGDRVWGSNQGLLGRQGTFAEYAAVGEEWLYPIPDSVSFEDAVAVALVGITAHLGLVRDARLQPGETILVQGGSGGVGSMVVQMAKGLGAKVIATAGTDEKLERCRQLGADLAINYKTEDIEKKVREFIPAGVNVWWETVREPNLELSIPLLDKGGRVVLMAGREAKPTLPLGAFYPRDCKILGFAMFNASPDQQRNAADDINRWLASGQLKANIDMVLPLDQAAEAHRGQEEATLQKSGQLQGKIVLKVQ